MSGGIAIKKETFNIKASDGRKLNTYAYRPQGTSKGIVHILHGMGEHAGRYGEFAGFLADNGMTVYAHDHRNHGRSVLSEENVGIFDKSESFETMVDDVQVVQAYIRSEEEDQQITILGHSMGSAILRRYLEKDFPTPDKAIIMGTLPRYTVVTGGFMFLLSSISCLFCKCDSRNKFIGNLMNRSMTKDLPESGSLNWLAHTPEVVEKYQQDPLSGFVYNKYFYNSFFRSLIRLNRRSEISKTAPVKTLFISGHDDPLSKNMRAIHKLADTHRKLVPEFQGEVKTIYKARHEVLNEANREYTFDYLLDWIMNK